ncbi:hypothetical protein PsorP6_016433 [Peronosclerospora sorghi]|uniref:Uncharacterized protein n=1 Tax=Peronosclerospora sorghi TaxID=230839 RepID=A0ACC0VQM6_9STRA|nr:hypothetical protein PsorP6_016433 [Peronosclerospora sorghi]
MNKCVLCFLSAAFVSARGSADSISQISDASATVLAPSPQAEGHSKQTLGVNDQATEISNEERGKGPAALFAESSTARLRDVDKTLSDAIGLDTSQIKKNKEFADRMRELGINIDGVIAGAEKLRGRKDRSMHENLKEKNLEWMVLGREYFRILGEPPRDEVQGKPQSIKQALADGFGDNSEEFQNFVSEVAKLFGVNVMLMKERMVHLLSEKFGIDYKYLAEMAAGSEILKNTDMDLSPALGPYQMEHPYFEAMEKQLLESGLTRRELAIRVFRPGGIVKGVVRLVSNQHNSNAHSEIAHVVAQVHGHVTVDCNLLTLPLLEVQLPETASNDHQKSVEHEVSQDAVLMEKINAVLPDVRKFSGDTGTCIFCSAPAVVLSDINIPPSQSELQVATFECPSPADALSSHAKRRRSAVHESLPLHY